MPRWQGGILFDDAMRSFMRAPLASERAIANDMSNVLLYSLIAAPIVDGSARWLASRGTWQDGLGIAAVDAGAYAMSLGLTELFKRVVGRERPYATAENLSSQCLTNPDGQGCGSDRNASFPSGHSSMAFTAAGLVCTHAIYLGPRSPWNAAICGTAMAAAAATASLRMVADVHYASDTLVGAAIGLTTGMLMPIMLHFAPWAPLPLARNMRSAPNRDPRPAVTITGASPFGTAGGGGLGITGQF